MKVPKSWIGRTPILKKIIRAKGEGREKIQNF